MRLPTTPGVTRAQFRAIEAAARRAPDDALGRVVASAAARLAEDSAPSMATRDEFAALYGRWTVHRDEVPAGPDQARTAVEELVRTPIERLTPFDRGRVVGWVDHLDAHPELGLSGRLGVAGSELDALARWRVDLGRGFGTAAPPLSDGPLPPHLLRRADAPAHLHGSAWPYTTFHGAGDEAGLARLVSDGVDVSRNERAGFGQGLYTALSPGGYGPVAEMAVRLRTPFVGTSLDAFDEFERLLGPRWAYESPEAVSQAMLGAGHDGLLLRNSVEDGGDWVVAYRNADVRIIVADDADDVRMPTPRRFPNAA